MAIALFPLACLLAIPFALVLVLLQQFAEVWLVWRLTVAGRSLPWRDVEAKLAAGVGTLIVERRCPKGPTRVWWTADDVIAAAPVRLPPLAEMPIPDPAEVALGEYGRAFAARYVAERDGTASLTIPSASARQRGETGQYLPGRVVTLVVWLDDYLVAVGGEDDVFRMT